MKGRRLKNLSRENTVNSGSKKGDYWKDARTGIWWAYIPDNGITSLENYKVTEHKDGTISVRRAIHEKGCSCGYLKRGKWRIV
jgi:hypothetical protein